MSLNFLDTLVINGTGESDNSQLKFYNGEIFSINGSYTPSYQDVTISGENSLNLINAKADGLNYLKLFGACKQSNLPDGYTQLKSISGITGKAWFDTGIAGNNNNLRFVFSGYKNSGAAYSAFFGNYVDEASNTTRLIARTNANGIIAEINRKSASSTATNTINYFVAHTYELYKESGISIIKVDGVQTETMADSAGTANSTNIAINGSKTNPSVPSSNVITTYQDNFQIYDGTTLIRNYVMAKRDSDNAIGMYDTVNDTFKISEGTDNFTAGVEIVPTPSNPISIWCNNGVLKSRSKSGLPVGYLKLNYISNASNTRIKVNVMPIVDDIEIELKCRLRDGSWYMFQSRASTQASMYGLGGAQATSSINFTWAGKSLQSSITRTTGNIATIKATAKDGVATLYVKDETAGVEDTKTDTYTTPPANYPSTSFYLWGNYSQYIGANANVYYLKFKVGGETVLEYIPAKDSNGVEGFYDTVTSNFIDTPTTGSMSGGSVKSDAEVYVDGTVVETVKDSLNNTATAENLLAVGTYKDEQEVLTGAITRKTIARVLDGTESWAKLGSGSSAYFQCTDWATDALTTNNSPACYCTHYKGYSASDTLGTSGVRVGSVVSQYKYLFLRDTRFESVSDFTAYLEQQLAGGTPIIIVYALATSTTESTTPQTLTLQQGTNTISITQASIDPLSLEANYKAGVTVTIQEVEDANLDNSVTVTIS